MNQNLENITANLERIYILLESLEKRQTRLEEKMDGIVNVDKTEKLQDIFSVIDDQLSNIYEAVVDGQKTDMDAISSAKRDYLTSLDSNRISLLRSIGELLKDQGGRVRHIEDAPQTKKWQILTNNVKDYIEKKH